MTDWPRTTNPVPATARATESPEGNRMSTAPSMKVLAFDIETGSVEEMRTADYPYIRLCGWKWVGSSDPVTISTDPAELVAVIKSADATTAQNGINFDLMALAVHGYITAGEYEALCRKSFDTMITERHLNPVAAQGRQASGFYSLGDTAQRYGFDGKDVVDFEGKRAILRRIKGDKYADKMKRGKKDQFGVLKEVLAPAYGGFHLIPQDDPDYIRYLVKDVLAQENVFLAQMRLLKDETPESRRYLRGEHYIAASLARSITLDGMRADADLAMKKWSAGQSRLEASKQLMHEKYGMPLEGAKPHVTNTGKAAFRAAILGTGISERALDANWPTNKDGSLATGKDVLNELIELFEKTKPEAAELCRTILAMNGERSVPGTVLDNLVGGRIHPYVGADQSTGRWSLKNPGFTVTKKHERDLFTADEGHVLAAIDLDQADMRVVAAISQEPGLIAIINDPNQDLHSAVAYAVFKNPDCLEEMQRNNGRCDCPLRHKAKMCGIGTAYGLGARQLSVQGGITVDEAKEFQTGFFGAFTVLQRFTEETRRAAGALQWGEEAPANDSYRILHSWAGRPVRVERDRAYTQSVASLGQAGTRDIMRKVILDLPAHIRLNVKAVIHDEIVIQLPDGPDAQERAQAVADSMAFDLNGVHITAGCSKVARNLASCYGY